MDQFGKRETSIMKGVGVCLMLIHHLFYDEECIEKCRLVLSGGGGGKYIVLFAQMCKVCVALFVFLSAYGLYRSYESYCEHNGESIKKAILFTWKHLKKLITGYWWAVVPFVVLGLITGMRKFETVYGTGFESIIYLFVDILGLGGRVDMNHMFNVTCWYIALAIGLYILFPLLYYLFRKSTLLFCGVILIMCFRPFGAILLSDTIWLIPFGLGMLFAKYNLFNWVISQIHSRPSRIGIILLLLGTVLLRLNYAILADGFFAIGIICFMLLVISVSPVIATVFEFIGKHSANIFMTHTFFYYYYFEKIIYAPKYPLLIFAFLLMVCLIYSIFLEYIKSITGILINRFHKRHILSKGSD